MELVNIRHATPRDATPHEVTPLDATPRHATRSYPTHPKFRHNCAFIKLPQQSSQFGLNKRRKLAPSGNGESRHHAREVIVNQSGPKTANDPTGLKQKRRFFRMGS